MAAWTVALIPMAFVNGILTGNPVLIYDDAENLGIRIGTIPFEDFFYNLLYMTWMISLYEWYKLRERRTMHHQN
jgi:lycopene cyclase domain-containing protein